MLCCLCFLFVSITTSGENVCKNTTIRHTNKLEKGY